MASKFIFLLGTGAIESDQSWDAQSLCASASTGSNAASLHDHQYSLKYQCTFGHDERNAQLAVQNLIDRVVRILLVNQRIQQDANCTHQSNDQ
jgi:hypothetical protein